MTSKPKVYQNYRFDELISFSKQNPNRARALAPIGISLSNSSTSQETTLNGFGLNGYTVYDLQPTGLLSMLVCIDDPQAYSLSTPAIRIQQTIEYCTRLQQKTDELRNGPLARKRKKIYELLAAIYNESTKLEEKDYIDLFHAIEYFKECYFILLNRAIQDEMETDKKDDANSKQNQILFSSNPICWKRDRPIWIADIRCRWIAIPTDTSVDLHKCLYDWLPEMEKREWVIQWPEVDGSKTELVEQLSNLSTWQDTDKKLTKDVLAVRLGKYQSLDLFNKWKFFDKENI
jgi:hypothetical protein